MDSETKKFWQRGEPLVWGTGAALSFTLVLAGVLLWVVLANGLGVFWPDAVMQADLREGSRVLGEITREELQSDSELRRYQFKVGNRDLYGLDFRWVNEDAIAETSFPDDVVVLERMEYGNFYGFLQSVHLSDMQFTGHDDPWQVLMAALERIREREEALEAREERISHLNNSVEQIQHELKELEYEGIPETDERYRQRLTQKNLLGREFESIVNEINGITYEIRKNKAVFVDAAQTEKEIVLADIVRARRPNTMGFFAKLRHYMEKILELITEEPRESNTEGGLFPAIFGTVLMIFIMSILSFPLGVVAGVYLREYAREGLLVRLVRIAVNNLAGIPSIVYGIFGLGFFVYGIGAGIDQIFFPERLPAPTFGTGGILWASLTLGLLTVPVVIVSTEEALGAIPSGVREGSFALGGTKFQTLRKLLLPMASPGIMTGFILAMARAAGEVAPLMITGVVKLAPALPVDGNFPFIHLDRKFMHLGFHIYDIGFQSPNVEAAKPMVYVTTLLLLFSDYNVQQRHISAQ